MEFDAKQLANIQQAIQTLTAASDLLCDFNTTSYSEMFSEFYYNCKNMAEELELVLENENEID